MTSDNALDARIGQGIELLTTYLNRDASTGALDEELLRAVLGEGLTDDDVIAALANMLLASELVMLTYQVKTGERPVDVLRQVAAHRQSGS